MPFASVNGQQLYLEDTAGNGPVVVFSHGNLMNRDMWAAQVEALRGEFRCVVWDGRLHGRTKDDGGLYTYWDAADDLLGLIVIPGAGHTPSLTHPDQVNGSLAAFLRQRA
jgi:3-oxoadipate enol-lactonase